jgi:hypothetical protein
MSTGLLEQRANYPYSQYEYGYGGGGSNDANNNGRKEIDCSHLLHLMLKDAGYSIDEVSKQTLTSPRYWKGKVTARAKTRIAAFQNPNDEESKRIGIVAENSTLEYHTDSLKKV